MPTKKLTALSIPTLAPGEWYDAVLPGLILRVGKKRRTWQFRYHAGGSYHRKPLGHFPAMELARCPRGARRKLIGRAERGAPTEASAPHPRSSDALTLGALFDRYEAMRTREGQRTKSLPKAMRSLRRNLKPCLSLPADQFSKADLRAARDAMIEADNVIAANRMLGYLGPVLRWAAEEDLIPVNFVAGHPPRAGGKAQPRADQKGNQGDLEGLRRSRQREAAKNFGRMVRFLLVTAQRRDEAASLRFGHILDGTWRQANNKSDRPQSLTLPPLAKSLVGQGGARDYVFAGPQRQAGRLLETESASSTRRPASRTGGCTICAAPRPPTCRSWASATRWCSRSSITRVPGVGGVYLRSELEKQKAEALAKWAVALTKIVGLVAERRA